MARKSNYDKSPATDIPGDLWKGWAPVLERLNARTGAGNPSRHILLVECYAGVHYDELLEHFRKLNPSVVIDMRTVFRPVEEIEAMTAPYMTGDRLFGRRAPLTCSDFIDPVAADACRKVVEGAGGLVLIFGHGAAVLWPAPDTLVYADMARWEIQQRFRRKEVNGLGVENRQDAPSIHYKRGYFIDWNVCDALKKQLLPRVDFWLDTHRPVPKMITGETFLEGLEQTVHRPFRVVPFFDPAPWGGQWMKEVCDLDRGEANYGWCFDCVPEENSLYLNVSGERFELPANDLVFYRPSQLLGGPVEARFGEDFPIRFDFLDTIGGGNLSLQVHPTTQYIRDTFGIYYTQDESYYLLDAEEGATVYLGLRTNVDREEMIAALKESQAEGTPFDAGRYVNRWPARKHDHFLIPGGTVHCSGAGAMVLEISATPSLFTFKLWDWGRLGLDGLPRPINIEHGARVIQWKRETELVRRELVNRIEPLSEGDGWREERTGLHENEFIETRRHWFTGRVPHHTDGGVNVLNLVEGDEVIVESPGNTFKPFIVHYAETFIVPACAGAYTIRPHGPSEGSRCATIKDSVRFRQ
jgi:mannose-6-phosphate isomerase class I